MSLHQLANHMSAQGRGPDSTLVHMSPREVSGLQSLAMAHGGTLTINPQTGLPEAGFLDSLMPTLLGGAATFFSGGAITPLMAAMGVGGLTALTSKDLGKGLMAGLGAYGGSGIMEGLAGFGENAIGAEAAAGALPSGINPLSEQAASYEVGQAAANKAAQAGASYSDKLSRGVTEGFKNPMNALSAIGGGSKLKGAAMFAGPAMAAFSAVDEPKTSIPEKSKTAFIRSFYKDPVTGQKMANPAIPAEDFGNRTLGEQYFAANGGLIALAGGGQTAYDYLDRKRSTSSDAGIVVDDTPPKPRLPPLGSDGKGSYTYNKDSKTWVWTPTAKPVVPVNPGVQTLMDTGGPGGNVVTPPSPFTPITDNGFFSNIAGRTTQPPAPVVEKSTYSKLAQLEQNQIQFQKEQDAAMQAQADREARDAQAARNAESAKYTGLSGLQARQAEIDAVAVDKAAADKADKAAVDKQDAADARENAREGIASLGRGQAGIADDRDARDIANAKAERDADIAQEKQTHINLTDKYEQALLDAANSAAIEAEAQEKGFAARQDEADAAVIAGNTVAKEAAIKTEADKNTATAPVLASERSTTSFATAAAEARQAREAQQAQVAREARQAAEAQQAQQAKEAQQAQEAQQAAQQAAADAAAFAGAQQAQEAQAQANREASTSTAPAPAPDTAPSAPAPDYGPSGSSDSGGFTSGADASGYGGGDLGGFLAKGGYIGRYSQGGLGSLGGYSDGGRLLRGPGDGVSDSIPATVGGRQPARLADGEFVVPARIVSELGNGSTEAGARALYKMMDRIQANRRKTTGKNSVAVNSKSHKYLPA